MHVIEKILVPIDGSELAEKALNHSLKFADLYNSEIELLNIVPPLIMPTYTPPAPTPVWVSRYPEELRENNEKMLSEALRKAKDESDLQISKRIVDGRPASKIIEVAKKGGFDLIIMGSRGLGNIEGLFLGSVSNGVINRSKTPVLIVKGEKLKGGEKLYEKILVPIDGSDASDKALNYALDLAEKNDSAIELLNVVEPATIPLFPYPTASMYLGRARRSVSMTAMPVAIPDWAGAYEKELKTNNERMLSEALKKAEKAKPDLKLSKKLVEGHPAEKIVETAKDGDFDLIVMGSHGLGGIREFFLGSTSSKVADNADRSVLIVK